MLYLIVFIGLFLLELLYFKIAGKYNIIDKPNERSSHTKITLRGGGVIFYFGVLAFFISSGFQYPWFFLGLTLITFISFLDDIYSLSNKIRIAVQLTSMLLMFYEVHLFGFPIWVALVALIFCVGIKNAYNFMDGINGITVANSVAILILLGIANNSIGFVNQDIIYFSIIACLVFGFFNFRRKAKTFAGDVGAVAIAFIILFLLLLLMIKTENLIYCLFLFVYGIDSVMTIIHRIRKKENIFEAHRSHLYQYLANEAKVNPLLVSGIYAFIQVLVGLLVMYMSNFDWRIQLVFFVMMLLLGILVYILTKNTLKKKYNFQ